MRVKYSSPFLLFFILLFSTVQSPAQQESIFKKFAGTYVTGHTFGGGSITLGADGTFSDGGGSDDGTTASGSGTYTLINGVLHIKYTKETLRRGHDAEELNLLDPKGNKEMSPSNGNSEIQKEYKYLPIEWSERIYLISEIDLKDFANAINLGLEPRSSLTAGWDTLPWYGSFYLRSGDQQKKVTGNPNLPKEWLSFLLREPMTATVINVEKIEKLEFVTISTATVNKGSKHGLKVGMRLVAKDEEPSPWDGPQVISVEKETAKIQARLSRTELKVGDKLSTRYEPKEFQR